MSCAELRCPGGRQIFQTMSVTCQIQLRETYLSLKNPIQKALCTYHSIEICHKQRATWIPTAVEAHPLLDTAMDCADNFSQSEI
jgi:hypothetical protein